MRKPKALKRLDSKLMYATALFACVAGGAPARAEIISPDQEHRTLISPERGFLPSHSYTLSEIESIDLGTGALGIRLPLAQLPPGPGGLTAGFTLLHSSKYWEIAPETGSEAPVYPLTASRLGGWRLVYGYELEIQQVSSFGQPCFSSDVYKTYNKLAVVTPDGSRHLLTLDNPSYPLCDGIGPTGIPGAHPQETWYSTDGSYLKLVIEAGSNWPEHQRTLYLPDGTKVKDNFEANVQTIEDRNGNIIRIEKDTQSGSQVVTIRDSFGHSISATTSYPGTPFRRDEITAKGYLGEDLNWTVVWDLGQTNPDLYVCEKRIPDITWYCDFDDTNPLVQSVSLPNGRSYQFEHNSYGGQLSKITLPTGGTATYTYGLDSAANRSPLTWYGVLANSPVEKLVEYREKDSDPAPTPLRWTYAFGETESTQIAPDGGQTRTEYYRVDYEDPGHDSILAGMVFRTTYPDSSTQERIWRQNNTPTASYMHTYVNPWVEQEYTTLARQSDHAALKTSAKVNTMDRNGNTTSTAEYDWMDYGSVPRGSLAPYLPTGLPAGAASKLIRTTVPTPKFPTPSAGSADPSSNSYYHGAAPALIRLISSRQLQAGGATVRDDSYVYYENGNLQSQTTVNSEPDSLPVTTSFEYDGQGRIKKVTDPRTYWTSYSYTDPNCAGPTAVERQVETGNTLTETFTYDASTCLKRTHTDANLAVTTWSYDRYGRVTGVDEAGVAGQSAAYSDAERWMVVRRDLEVRSGGTRQTAVITHFDQLSRVRLERRMETVVTQSTSDAALAADETAGIKVRTRRAVEAGRNLTLLSNPYREAAPSDGVSTTGWTLTATDTMGRVVSVETFAGAAAPAPFGPGNSQSTGRATTDYDVEANGASITATDQALKVKKTYSDALGRLTSVVEDPSDLNYLTSYLYNAQDNLTGVCQGGTWIGAVCQGGQSRSFAYSSLGRLLSATNPESRTSEYRYDASGNPRLKWDERTNSTVTMAHDGLNRVTSRTYADGTPDVSYGYDTCASGKGRLCSVGNTVSSSSFGYDALGRITASSQTTGEVTYPFQYEYNLADGLRKMVYPSGRVVTTCYDEAGRARLVHNGALGTVEACDTATTENYAVVAGYTAHGAARDVQLGNLLWERTEYNSRLQATDLRLGTSQGSSEKWRLENGYSLAANNGNVMSQTLTPLNVTQNFQYDGVNRLKVASEGAAWSWTFDYDARGNQWVSEWSGLIPGSFTPTSSSWYEAATNRLTGAPSADYDEAGNQKQVGGYSFLYDAESRVKESTISGGTTSYAYDGQGRRVKKVLGSNTTVFVYDAFGQLAAEYSTGEPTEFGTQYLTADHLGSTRVVTDSSGDVTERHDYRPFGEELFVGTSGRTADLKYPGADTGVRLKFTGKERDVETGLDYFLARYYSAAQGRFTSPDEWAGGIVDPFTGGQVGQPGPLPYADITDPQTINKYAYVRNNPLRYTDPDGHIIDTLADIGFIAYDIYKIAREGATKTNVTALAADVGGALLPFATGGGLAVRAGVKGLENAGDLKKGAELLVDSNAIVTDGKRLVESGQNIVKADVALPELRNAVANPNSRLSGVPKAANAIPTVPGAQNVNTRINVRGQLPAGPGRFGDGVTGATAIERGSTLVTRDKNLKKAVENLGGKVKKPEDIP